MKNISIIIPVYNGEKYIDSICRQLSYQTFQNFEVIFIDDCSSDNSYKKVIEAAKEYSFITVLRNKKNQGAGFSRNKAIEKAKYDYIAFLDCDDEIPANYFKELTNLLFKEKADMVLCDVKIVYGDGFIAMPDFYNVTCHTSPVQKKDIIHNDIVAASWNKIIKKELLLKNPFCEGIINEDIPAIIGSIFDAKKIVYTNKTYYSYIQRKSSVQNGSKISKKFDVFLAVEELISRKKNDFQLQENMDAIIYHQIIQFLLFGIITIDEIKKKWKYLRQFEKKSKKYNIRKNPYLIQFLNSQGKKNKLYYNIILKSMAFHFFYVASFIIFLGNTYSKIKNRNQKNVVKFDISLNDLVIAAKRNQYEEEKVSISVVIPNYNYGKYLYQRFYSILYQNVKIKEIIILDDFSNDDSISIINEICNALQDIMVIKKEFNATNSGSPFKQWNKGFQMATADYVWIAEADDYSAPDFLKNVTFPMIKNDGIVLSYCDTSYIHANGSVITNTVTDLIDIMKTGHWNKNYVNDGMNEIENYAFLNCTIANVSSVIFKNGNYQLELAKASDFKQCGDWYFYYSIMKKGSISFSTKSLNYCRLHGDNSTTNLKKEIHYREIKKVQKEIIQNCKVRKDANKHIEKRLKNLREVWDLEDKKIL